MCRSFRWSAVVLSLLVIGGVVMWTARPARVLVTLANGGELRVLKVSLGTKHQFSTESRWKQCARCILPRTWEKPLGQFQGQRFDTRHDSLVVWLGEFDPQNGQVRGNAFSKPEVVFPGGTMVQARMRPEQGRRLALQFDCFPRDLRQITLQVRDGAGVVRFDVTNPRPARAARWNGQPLPQTNQSARTEVVLHEPRRGRWGPYEGMGREGVFIPIRERALGKGELGWTRWRITVMDSSGNWAEGSWRNGRAPLPLLPRSDSPWKLIVEGEEYFSAGFVTQPGHGSWQVLRLNPRAGELGVRFVAYLGPGEYRFGSDGDGVVVEPPDAALSAPSLKLFGSGGTTNWVLKVNTPASGILCLTQLDHAGPAFRSRLRERDRDNRGAIFGSSTLMAATNTAGGRTQVAQFFTTGLPRRSTAITNLEVEVIAPLPPVDFFITPPSQAQTGQQEIH